MKSGCHFFLFILLLILHDVQAHAEIDVSEVPNFSVNHHVTVSKKTIATPKVKVNLRGANEVKMVTFILERGRYRYFNGNGQITQLGSDVIWTPGHLNASLEYEVILPHERKKDVYDSFGKKDWFITRTNDLFAYKKFAFRRSSKSLTTVSFDLPSGWEVETEMLPFGQQTYRTQSFPGHRYEWPTGWIIFGRIERTIAKADDVVITIAYPKAFLENTSRIAKSGHILPLSPAERFSQKMAQAQEIYEKVIPLMKKFLPQYARRFLVIYGEKPMWMGGLSGENSLFINRRISNLSKDYSSTLVHEFFHVCQGFKKNKKDGEWLVEGLAEYFSLLLLEEAGITTPQQFRAGIESYKKNGQWNVNLTKSFKKAVLYENAPLIFFTLDEMIKEKTQGQKSLKNVMAALALETDAVGTKEFREAAELVYGDSLKSFFITHVYDGKIPDFETYLK
jgi:hypothetical protein